MAGDLKPHQRRFARIGGAIKEVTLISQSSRIPNYWLCTVAPHREMMIATEQILEDETPPPRLSAELEDADGFAS